MVEFIIGLLLGFAFGVAAGAWLEYRSWMKYQKEEDET